MPDSVQFIARNMEIPLRILDISHGASGVLATPSSALDCYLPVKQGETYATFLPKFVS